MPTRSTPHPLAKLLGRRVQALRTEKGWTRAQLAKRMKCKKGYVARIEHGLIMVRLGTVQKLADCLGVRMFDILTFPEENGVQRIVDVLRKASPSDTAAFEKQLKAVERNPRSRQAVARLQKILRDIEGRGGRQREEEVDPRRARRDRRPNSGRA